MRDYAVTLEFDKDSAARIQEMIDEVAVVTGCDHMKKYSIPPHVTVSCFIYDDEDRRSTTHPTALRSPDTTKSLRTCGTRL